MFYKNRIFHMPKAQSPKLKALLIIKNKICLLPDSINNQQLTINNFQ